jgi:hypothetical protein
VLDYLADSIARWKIREFKLSCDLENVDVQRLFDALASAPNLKRFFLCSTNNGQILSPAASRPLINLALSPTSGLLEIFIFSVKLKLSQFITLFPEDVDPNIAARRHLRLMNFMDVPEETGLEDFFNEDGCIVETLKALVDLMSKQLPYLHHIGLTSTILRRYGYHVFEDSAPDAHKLWNQVWVQMEQNDVGMALFHPSRCSTLQSFNPYQAAFGRLFYTEQSQILNMLRVCLGLVSTTWSESS